MASSIDIASEFPTPWTVADFDGRIVILASNGRRVSEIEPSQRGGQIPTKDMKLALAHNIVAHFNCPLLKIVRPYSEIFPARQPTNAAALQQAADWPEPEGAP